MPQRYPFLKILIYYMDNKKYKLRFLPMFEDDLIEGIIMSILKYVAKTVITNHVFSPILQKLSLRQPPLLR